MLLEPKCWTRECHHYIGIKQDNEEEETERHVCRAFPNGIPEVITYGKDLHEKPLVGQKNNIVYEKK